MKRYLPIILSIFFMFFVFCVYNTTKSDAAKPITHITTSATKKTPIHHFTTKNSEPPTTEICLWTFPVGDFGKKEIVEQFISAFNRIHPEIHVTVETLDYTTGDTRIEKAIEARMAPDIIMEGPERLLANWGARGLMIDLRDMWDEKTILNISKVSPEIVKACRAPDGAFYEYPMVMTTHLMAINYELFEKAGALKFINQETRSWTTKDFVAAMEAIRDSGLVETPGIIYSGGQGGDQGTRALVSNLYHASFTNNDHSAYTINKESGVKGLELLIKMVKNNALSHHADLVASDELQLFAAEKTAITLAWNATNESLYANQVNFTPFAMNFPAYDGIAKLQGGIWGFGIFNKGDINKVNAAKKLIRFFVDDPTQSQASILATQFFPVKHSSKNVYANTENEARMSVYISFLKNLGDYYQRTPAWPEQRIAWYTMLQQIFNGANVQEATNNYVKKLNSQIHP